MRRILKVLVILVVLILLGVGAALGYLFLALPKVEPPTALKVAGTPDQVARGAYLANHVTVCLDCHSKHDTGRYANPVVPGTQGEGGEVFGHAQGFPGEVHPSNITPAALADWSDGEVMRAMTSGISRDGQPLFPLMPYPVYAQLSQGDAEAIVAYLRTLPARGTVAPPRTLDFPLSLIVRTIPTAGDAASRHAAARQPRLRPLHGDHRRLPVLPHAGRAGQGRPRHGLRRRPRLRLRALLEHHPRRAHRHRRLEQGSLHLPLPHLRRRHRRGRPGRQQHRHAVDPLRRHEGRGPRRHLRLPAHRQAGAQREWRSGRRRTS